MHQIQSYDQFPFWTPPRVRAIKSGVWSFIRDDQIIVRDRLHLIQHMSAWHRAMGQRPWLLAHILEALSDDQHVQNCKFHNMQGILFDRAHFCRFFKLHDPIEESSVGGPRIGFEPVTVRRARELPSTQMMFPPSAFGDEFIPPLSYLCVYDIGYFVRRRKIVELYILRQDGFRLHAMQPLGLFDDNFPLASQDSA